MNPSQLASHLRQIASKIDASKKPNRHLVASELKRTIAMVSKTANAPKIDVTWLEGGGYGPADIVGSLGDPNQGPVWVGFHGFGWIITNVDPASIPDETPIDHVIATTWGEAKAQEDLAEAVGDMKQYPSIQDFAADDQTIRWMCSYEEEEREPIKESLVEHGFDKAAGRVDAVEF